MTIFLVEIFLLGFLIAHIFYGKLPNVFLGLSSPLLGICSYVFNVLFYLILKIEISLQNLSIIIGSEILVLFLYHILVNKNHISYRDSVIWVYLGVSIATTAIITFFYKNNYSYGGNDTLYMIIMARNILETGISKWYFASPASMGIFVPILQTLGMLFNYDYTWFIQPYLSLLFYAFFFYFSYQTMKKQNNPTWLAISLPALLIAGMLSSNLLFVFTTYIHSNLDSAFFLFLTLSTLLNYLDNKQDSWLIFSTIFLIFFGLTRIENIVFACALILVFIGDGKIPYKKLLSTFISFLVFSFIWYLIIYTLHTNSFTDQMNSTTLFLTFLGIFLTLIFLVVSNTKHIRNLLNQHFFHLSSAILIILLFGLLILDFNSTLSNVFVTLQNLFITGNWGFLWQCVLLLSIIIINYAPKISHEKVYLYLIAIFFELIIVLGSLREPYHLNYYDSANRMAIHILPFILFYLITKISSWFEKLSITSPD